MKKIQFRGDDFNKKLLEAHELPYKDFSIYYGIKDNLGIDIIHKFEDGKDNPSFFYLDLRCRFNCSRDPFLFVIAIRDNVVPPLGTDDTYELFKERAISISEEKY